jgi:hypothetical protein
MIVTDCTAPQQLLALGKNMRRHQFAVLLGPLDNAVGTRRDTSSECSAQAIIGPPILKTIAGMIPEQKPRVRKASYCDRPVIELREIWRVLRPGNSSYAIVGSQKGNGMSHVKKAARIEAIRKIVEQMNRDAVCYITRVPRHDLPEGRVLVHNDATPQPQNS